MERPWSQQFTRGLLISHFHKTPREGEMSLMSDIWCLPGCGLVSVCLLVWLMRQSQSNQALVYSVDPQPSLSKAGVPGGSSHQLGGHVHLGDLNSGPHSWHNHWAISPLFWREEITDVLRLLQKSLVNFNNNNNNRLLHIDLSSSFYLFYFYAVGESESLGINVSTCSWDDVWVL